MSGRAAIPGLRAAPGSGPRPHERERLRPFASAARLAARASIAAHLALLRPRILALVVFTAVPSLLAGALPTVPAAAALLLATVLLGASCDAFNAWIERGTDGLMARTRDRPLPTGRLAPSRALAFAAACGLASLALYLALHPLAAAAAALVLAHYVVVYSLWLKRRTPWNIVIGGVAGGAAPLLADLALHGSAGPVSWLLLAIVTAWTPPHFWAIALVRKEEYAAAGIPMLPVVAGDDATRAAMLRWTVVLLATSLLPLATGHAGLLYALALAPLGAWFLRAVLRARRDRTRAADRAVFLVSVRWLGLLVAAWSVESALTRLAP